MENRAIRIPIVAGATRTAAALQHTTNSPVSTTAPNPSPAAIITTIYTRSSQRISSKKTVALNIPATKRPNPAPPSWHRCCTLSRATHLPLHQQPPRLHLLQPNHLSSPPLPPRIIPISPSSSSSSRRTALRRRQMIKSGMRWWPTSRASRGPPRSHRSSRRSSRRATRPTTRPRSSPRHRRLAPAAAAPPRRRRSFVVFFFAHPARTAARAPGLRLRPPPPPAEQTLYQHPDHHLWMHNHARHATTSPAAGGQQRKRRHRGSGTATTHVVVTLVE